MLLELRDGRGLGLFFSVALLCDEKIIVFIIKCGNSLVLRSPGLLCGGDAEVGSAWLSWSGADEMALRASPLLADGQDSPERALRTPGSPSDGVAEPHPHLSLAHVQNALRINWLGTTVPLPSFHPVPRSLSQAQGGE